MAIQDDRVKRRGSKTLVTILIWCAVASALTLVILDPTDAVHELEDNIVTRQTIGTFR